MRLLIIICFTTLFLCAECGLIKNIFGAVVQEVDKIQDGNIVLNVVNKVHSGAKGIVEDLGDLIHMKKNIINKIKQKASVIQIDGIPNTTKKPVTVQITTAKIDKHENLQPDLSHVQDNDHPTESIVNEPINTNQAVDSTQITSESSVSNQLVFKDEDYNFGEGKIDLRMPRHIKIDDKAIQDPVIDQIKGIDDNNINSSVGEDIIYANTNVKELFFNNDDFNENIDLSNLIPSGNATIETIVIGGCPEGTDMSDDGSCIIESTTKTQIQGKNRANFVGGCLQGFSVADDGTCQEVIYD